MLKKITFVFLLLVFNIIRSNAQCCGTEHLMVQQITASPFIMYYLQYDSVPFADSKWSDASLKLVSGEVYDSLKVKIDIYKDDLIYYNATLHKQLIIDKLIIDEVSIKYDNGNQAYLVRNICVDDTLKMKKCDFYFIHLEDSISLWSKQKKDIVLYGSISTKKLGYYYTVVKYKMVINNEIIDIPLSKRKLAKFFPNNQKAILVFIRKNHIKIKNSSHLVRLFVKINELEKASKAI
jgi:hypothetical protein